MQTASGLTTLRSVEEQLQLKIRSREARAGVIGLGYVGLPLALELVQAGFAVSGEPFYGKRINIASDELTGTEMATALAEVTGRAVSYKELPLAELRTQSDDMARMYDWFNRVGYSVDLQKLRKDYPEVKWRTFREWAGRDSSES